MRVNFSVTNQLATPSIHAAALANRPPAGQPGRLFVDTDNPSTGIYRDTGTVWENITGGAGASNLQTVTDAGNTTDNNILLTYADNTIANALVFYNDALTQEEYLIEKRGTGITTNDSLAIQSRGNISPSTNPVGFLIDGANDIVKSFYTTSYTEVGLKLDFVNQSYDLGNSASTLFRVNDSNGRLQSKYNGDDIGISFDLQNGEYYIGDFDGISNGVFFLVDNTNNLIKTATINGDIGLKLDFGSSNYFLGDFNGVQNSAYIYCNNDTSPGVYAYSEGSTYMRIDIAGAILGDYANALNGTCLFVAPPNGLINTSYQGSDAGVKLDFINATYYFGDFDNIVGSGTAFVINDNTQVVSTQLSQNDRGMIIDFQNEVFKLGYDFTNDFFGIDSANDKLIASTNLLVGSSGSSSGQHLKIKVGTTDYVIELKNP